MAGSKLCANCGFRTLQVVAMTKCARCGEDFVAADESDAEVNPIVAAAEKVAGDGGGAALEGDDAVEEIEVEVVDDDEGLEDFDDGEADDEADEQE